MDTCFWPNSIAPYRCELLGSPSSSNPGSRLLPGYRIEIIFLRLPSPQLAFRRIAARVRQGGHHVPRADVLRRFTRSWHNFQKYYRPLADHWEVYDNSQDSLQLLEIGP